MKNKIIGTFIMFFCVFSCLFLNSQLKKTYTQKEENYIKWVEFNIPMEIMKKAMQLDINSRNEENEVDFIEILSYMAAENYGSFKGIKASDVEKTLQKIKASSEKPKMFSYYEQAYSAIMSEYLGDYEKDGKTMYGLKVKHPLNGYYTHCDDFGASRNYGFKRKHLGHDLMTSIGTPVCAVEDGVIEAIGWNRYGGWRIGVRSFDSKRYYYYAHLRKDNPYIKGLQEGKTVKAGEIIGYAGRTGYSIKENVNNIDTPHLHFGIQLIFDESQKDGNNQIWINCYEITKLLKNPPLSIEVKGM